MARPLRIEYPGAVYHITSRGNEKKAVYRNNRDRESFLSVLHRVNHRYNWICHAYCLMDNHYHLLIETPDGNLSIGMRQLNGIYTQLFNKRHERTGHLLQGRYNAILVQKDRYLLEVCRYIVLDPVRAGRVEGPEDWTWSSHCATAGRGKPHPCLTTEGILGQFDGKKDKAEEQYFRFVQWGIGNESIWSKVKGQVILGGEEFVVGLADYLKKYREVPEIPKSQRYVNRPTLEKILQEDIIRDKRKRNRKIAEAAFKHGYNQSEIARHLGLHYSTISNLLRQKT
jgi:putative transposase